MVFLSMEQMDGYVSDDTLVHPWLEAAGWEVLTVPWKKWDTVGPVDAMVIRTTWDYHRHLSEFLRTLENIEQQGIPLANKLSLVRWNSTKTYLLDLQDDGILIVPTIITQMRDTDPKQWFDAFNTEQVVIKPLIGANAERTFRLDQTGLYESVEWKTAFGDDRFIVQPYLDQVASSGEVSLVYLNGLFSHALSKVPKAGDFRVQEEHGGIISPLKPDRYLLQAAEKVIRTLNPKPVFARVDVVQNAAGAWCLMELELIEPSLYLRTNPEAPGRFARVLTDWCDSARQQTP